MKWRGREESSNIDDQRSQTGGGLGGLGGGSNPFGRGGFRIPTGGGGGGRSGGGLGLLGVVVVLGLIWFFTGQNPLQVLTNGTSSSGSSVSTGAAPTAE